MNHFTVRDGSFDVVVVAGPRIGPWPSVGVGTFAALCSEFGLSVGLFGGDDAVARGVIPLPGTGGLVLLEDAQNRIHRVRARVVVRLASASLLPDPFPGWRSQAVLPLPTAIRLKNESRILWGPRTVVLGTGNRALRFGSSLLDCGVPEVVCVEPYAQWGAKRFAGWEVERRKFEMSGGKIIEGRPVELREKQALSWQLDLDGPMGKCTLDVARVVSAGPFRDLPGLREYPPGSLLFELEQSAGETREEDLEGWVLEEERGRFLAAKVLKVLTTETGKRREKLERIHHRSRVRLKRYLHHRDKPFVPEYQGKWVSTADSKKIRAFSGVPKQEHQKRLIASVECFEEVPCDLCTSACLRSSLPLTRVKGEVLVEKNCAGCGRCLASCPSGAIVLVREPEGRPMGQLTLPWRGKIPWCVGELASLVNRQGELLGSGRVLAVTVEQGWQGPVQLVQIEVPSHLLWEARGLRRVCVEGATDEAYLKSVSSSTEPKVEITLNGEKRLVRDQIPLTIALYEMGQGRPEDALFCADGSCGLCGIIVDGVKKHACQTQIHRGMSIRLPKGATLKESVCNCHGVTREQIIERIRQGRLKSAEAVVSMTHVGEGRCHGQVCREAFRRILLEEGLDVSDWIDWRFPWSEWVINVTHGRTIF